MGEQNGNLAAIEKFLVKNAKEISELKIELLKLHFEEIKKLAQNINMLKPNGMLITDVKKRVEKLIELVKNFKKDDGGLYEYDADIFDNDETEIDAIRTKNLLFSIVRSLYLILCNSKERGELHNLRNSLDKFKFNKDNGDIDKYIKLYEKNEKNIEYLIKNILPNNNLQPVLKEESKVVQPEQKRSVLSRFTGLFGSNKKSGAINIEESLKKIEESIKKQREEYAQVAKKEGEEDNINRSITDAETKFLELKEVKKKIDALNVKINDSEIVNKKKIELSEVKEKYEKDNATKDIATVDKELADLKKNPKNNKKKLQKEAQIEKETAEAEFKALEETLNTEITKIREQIDKLKKNNSSTGGGGKRIKYKSTGNEVVIFHKNRESKKTVYVKEKTTTKYCKINNKYILLSKLNVID
jgi:hypothetical protein